MKVEAFRLLPGEDLYLQLQKSASALGGAGFILSAVGSLRPAVLRFAGRSEARVLDEDLEILSLSGTLGEGGIHLHICVSDSSGGVQGGHLLPGSVVRTTAEIVLGIEDTLRFQRSPCPISGYEELLVKKA